MSWLCTTCVQCGEGILIEENEELICESCRRKAVEPKTPQLSPQDIAIALRCHAERNCAACPNREKLQLLADKVSRTSRKEDCVQDLLLRAAEIIEKK